jgi:small subunit ribosomal protein S8e
MNKGKKISGGRYHKQRKKKLREMAAKPRVVKLGASKKKKIRVLGGNSKTIMLIAETVSVMDEKRKKGKKVKILNVLETPNNKFLAKQNIITKGTIIETEIGKARVTNRPGQEGSVQAVLIEEAK